MNLLEDYVSFVDEVTSIPSKSLPDMIESLEILEEQITYCWYRYGWGMW